MRDPLRILDQAAPWLFLAFILLGAPALYAGGAMDITSLNQLGRFLALAIVALGIDLIWGYTGVLSLQQAMFFCVGGYAIGMHLVMHGPLDGEGIPRCLYVVTSVVSGFKLPLMWRPFGSLPISIALCLLLPGLFAAIFGFFTFRSRVRGVYFSIITQAMTYAAWLLFCRNELRLCGTNGLTNFVTLAGFELTKPAVKIGLYLVTAATLAIVYFLCNHIVRSRLGRLLIAVRDNESRLRFAGYQPVTLKVFAFTTAAVLAAIGGMLYTPQNGIITPFKMTPYESVFMVVWVAVGGRGTLRGAVVGSLFINYISSILTTRLPVIWPYVLGALCIGVVLLFPDGLVGAWNKWLERRAAVPPRSSAAILPIDAPPRAQEGAAAQ